MTIVLHSLWKGLGPGTNANSLPHAANGCFKATIWQDPVAGGGREAPVVALLPVSTRSCPSSPSAMNSPGLRKRRSLRQMENQQSPSPSRGAQANANDDLVATGCLGANSGMSDDIHDKTH